MRARCPSESPPLGYVGMEALPHTGLVSYQPLYLRLQTAENRHCDAFSSCGRIRVQAALLVRCVVGKQRSYRRLYVYFVVLGTLSYFLSGIASIDEHMWPLQHRLKNEQ